MIRISYRPTQADLIHAARTWEGKHWRTARYIVAAALVVFGSYAIVAAKVWWGVVFIILGLSEAFNLLPAAVIRAIIEYRTNPKFKEEYQLTFSAEKLHFLTPTIDSTLKWSMYSSYIETEKALILVYGKRMFTVIPKRAFENVNQLTELRQLLSKVITSRARVA